MPPFVAVGNSGRTTDVLSDTMVGWIFASKDASTGRTTYLAGGIPPGEFHPLVGNTVDVWTFVKGRTFVA